MSDLYFLSQHCIQDVFSLNYDGKAYDLLADHLQKHNARSCTHRVGNDAVEPL